MLSSTIRQHPPKWIHVVVLRLYQIWPRISGRMSIRTNDFQYPPRHKTMLNDWENGIHLRGSISNQSNKAGEISQASSLVLYLGITEFSQPQWWKRTSFPSKASLSKSRYRATSFFRIRNIKIDNNAVTSKTTTKELIMDSQCNFPSYLEWRCCHSNDSLYHSIE